METLLQDIRYAIRMLIKSPGLTAVAVLSLAIGIGANTTIFSWVQAVLLRPFPGVSDPDRLKIFSENLPSMDHIGLSYPDYVDYRDRNEVLSGLLAQDGLTMSVTIGNKAERAWGAIVSGNYFDVVGVKAAEGRTFLPDEDRTPGAHPVVVLSHNFWLRKLNADPAIVGSTIILNNHQYTVIGIAPEKFMGTFMGIATELWVPMMMANQLVSGSDRLNARGDHWLDGIARIKPGVSVDEARANLDTLARQLAAEYPNTNENRGATLLESWQSPWGAPVALRPILMVLMAVVGLVLLIACANVANLLVARAMNRRKEIAIRLSMGATRTRLVRQLLTESMLLALTGGALGFVLTFWSADLLMAFTPPTDMPINLAIEVNSRVLIFTALISLGTGILFGLIPALQASKASIVTVLKDESARVSGGKGRLRSVLVIAQVALSLVLLIAAALFLQSFINGQSMDTGFEPKNLAISSFDLFPGGYTTERGIIFQQQVLQKVEALPGVESAAFARRVPLGFGGSSSTGVAIDGYEPRRDENMSIFYNNVTPGYFLTMSIPILYGREFTTQDVAGSRRVVIINETMARRFWPGQDAIGRIIRNGKNELEVVGVARDGKYQSLGEKPMPYMYFPLAQSYRSEVVLIVRSTGSPASILPSMRETVRSMDTNLPLFDTMTMTEFLTAAVFAQRIAASFLGVFGALALLLSAVGLYSVIAYSVTRRTHEIGIRMALGAGTVSVLTMVLRQGLGLVMIGTMIGLVASFGATRLLSSLLYGVSATDPLTFVSVSLLLFIVALIACFVPARRAIKIDPMIALRYE